MKKMDASTKKSQVTARKRKERALSRDWTDSVTGFELIFVTEAGDLRKFTLNHSAHLNMLIKKYRLEDGGYTVTRPDQEIDMYPKHKRRELLSRYKDIDDYDNDHAVCVRTFMEEEGVTSFGAPVRGKSKKKRSKK